MAHLYDFIPVTQRIIQIVSCGRVYIQEISYLTTYITYNRIMPINTFLGNSGGYLTTNIGNITPEGQEAIINLVDAAILDGDIEIPNPPATNTALNDLTDVTIDNTLGFSQVLFYDDIGFNPGQWINRSLTTSLIPEPQVADPPNKYYTETRFTDSLKAILTTNSDLLTRNSTGDLVRLPKGLANQILSMNGTADAIIWKNGDNLISLNNLSDVIITNPATTQALKYNGTEWVNENIFLSDVVDVDIDSPANGDCLVYDNDKFINRRLTQNDIDNAVNNLNELGDTDIQTPVQNQFLRRNPAGKWSNQSIDTDAIPAGVTNQYYEDTKVSDYIKTILVNPYDLLTRNLNDDLIALSKGAASTYLRSSADSIAYAQIRYNEILERTTMVRENITIPANGTVNMLDWLMNSTIFDDMIRPAGSPVNPFDWRTRGDANYGMWHITNGSNAEITLDRVNIDLAANFIIWNFIRSLINNIMDDNLNDGTVRVRPLGINHAQTGGNAQIINTTVNNLGKFRTISAGTGITVTQTDDTITFSCTVIGGATNLDGLTDVVITSVDNNQFLRYSTANTRWENQSITTDNIPEGLINFYYSDTRVNSRLLNVLTTNEDLLIRRGGVLARLPVGGAGEILKVVNGTLTWTPNEAAVELSGLLDVDLTDFIGNESRKFLVFDDVNLFRWTAGDVVISDINTLQDTLDAKIPLSTVTTAGDLIYATGNSAVTRLPISTNGKVLYTSAGLPSWQSLGIADITNLTSSLASKVNNLYVDSGDLIIGNGTNSYVKLSKGTDGQVLSVVTGNVQWANPQSGATDLNALTDVTLTAPTTGQLLYKSAGDWINRSVTTSDIVEGTNLYYINTRVSNHLLSILTTNEDILIRRGGVLARLPVAINTGDVLTYNGVSGNIEWLTPNTGITTLHGLQDVMTDEPPQDKMFLMYNPSNGTGVDDFWVNSLAGIADITGLQAALDAKINASLLTTEGDLLIRGATTVERLPKGNSGQYLGVVNGNVEWGNVSLNVSQLSDVNITGIQDNQVLMYNSTATDWKNVTLDTSMIPENTNMYFTFERVDTNLQNKYNGKGVIQIGTGNLSYTAHPGPTADNQVLFGKDANNTGVEWRQATTSDIIESTNLYYTDTRVDTRLNSKYTAKGRIQVGTGNNTYEQQAAPGADTQVLVSDINNLVNNTGLTWRLLNMTDLNDNLINTPVNGNALMYNGAKWVNSTQVSTNVTNIANLAGRVNTLEANVFSKTIDPAVSPYTYSYNQIDQPIVNATYIANTGLIPLDDFLAPALNNADFINCGGGYQTAANRNGGIFNGVVTTSNIATRLLQNAPPSWDTDTFNNVDYTQVEFVVTACRININYRNNPLTPGAYTLFASNGNFAPAQNPKWYGLKNQAILAAQFAIFNQEPVAGADWDLLGTHVGNVFNGGAGVVININTNVQYFMIAIILNNTNWRVSSFGIAASQTINENYTFGNQLSLSASSGDLVVTKNTALANDEQWTLRPASLVQYYTQNIVNKVIRSIGQINLNNSIFEDYRVRINNIFNSFSFQNSAGNTTYLTVNTGADKVTIPRNVYYCASLQDAVIPTTINNNGVVYNLNLGAGLVVENDNTPGVATFDGFAQSITINIAGTYKIDFNIVYFPDNTSDNCEMFLLDAGGGAWQGCYKRNSAVTDKYTQVTMSTIRTWAVNDVLRPSFRAAQNAPFTLVTTSWSLVITNTLTT